jgi:hypothetical protein
VLERNPGFLTFTTVCLILRDGDDVDLPKDVAPEKISLLKYAPVTAFDVIPQSFLAKDSQ